MTQTNPNHLSTLSTSPSGRILDNTDNIHSGIINTLNIATGDNRVISGFNITQTNSGTYNTFAVASGQIMRNGLLVAVSSSTLSPSTVVRSGNDHYSVIVVQANNTLAIRDDAKSSSSVKVSTLTDDDIPVAIVKYVANSGNNNSGNDRAIQFLGYGQTVRGLSILNSGSETVRINADGTLTKGSATITLPSATGTLATTDGVNLATNAIDTANIQANAVTTAKITDANITTAKIADDAVTADKLANTTVSAGSYTNTNITVDAQGRITSAISGSSGGGGITIQDEGNPLSTAATTLNFVGAGVIASGTGATKTITISGGGGTVSSGTFTATAGSPSTLQSYTYDSAELVFEYTVFVKNGSNYQTQKLLVMRDGTTVDSTQYAIMHSNGLLVQLDATISGGNVNLRATPETGVNGSTTYRIKREVM